MMRGMAQTSLTKKAEYFASFLIGTTVMGAAAIQKILSTSSSNATAGGGAASGGGGGTPAPEMMSGAFDLSGVNAPEPVQAYVVTDDMTNSQDKLATIRRRATI